MARDNIFNYGLIMRFPILSLMAFALLIAGCSPSEEPLSHAPSEVSVSGAALPFDRVIFPGGAEVVFDGRLVRYDHIQKSEASFERFTIFSKKGLMGLEGSSFAELAKLGYTRRIRKEEAGLFVVNYQKKGSVTISAAYYEHSTEFPADNIRSKAVYTWRVND